MRIQSYDDFHKYLFDTNNFFIFFIWKSKTSINIFLILIKNSGHSFSAIGSPLSVVYLLIQTFIKLCILYKIISYKEIL